MPTIVWLFDCLKLANIYALRRFVVVRFCFRKYVQIDFTTDRLTANVLIGCVLFGYRYDEDATHQFSFYVNRKWCEFLLDFSLSFCVQCVCFLSFVMLFVLNAQSK